MRSPQEFADILEQHNRWRMGEETKPTEPALLGQAIDAAVAALRAGQVKAEDPAPKAGHSEASEDYFTPPEWMAKIIAAVRRATEELDMDVVVAVEHFGEVVSVRAGGSKFMFSSESLNKFYFEAERTAHIACVVAKGLKGKECSNA